MNEKGPENQEESVPYWYKQSDGLFSALGRYFKSNKVAEDNRDIYEAYLIAKSSKSHESNLTVKDLHTFDLCQVSSSDDNEKGPENQGESFPHWDKESDGLFYALEKFFITNNLNEDNHDIYKAFLTAKSSKSHETYFTLKELVKHSSLNLSIPKTCVHPAELDNIKHHNAIEELRTELFSIKSNLLRKSPIEQFGEVPMQKDIVDGFTFIMIEPFSRTSLAMIIIFCIQMTSCFLAVSNHYFDREVDSDFLNTPNLLIPKGVEQHVHVGQGIAIPVIIIVSDQLWEGVVSLAKGYNVHYKNQGIFYTWWFIANIMRIILGLSIAIVTFILIITSDNVVDLFKDFTAMLFIVSFDNLLLVLSSIGVLGQKFQETAERCNSVMYKKSHYERRDLSIVSRHFNTIRRFLTSPLIYVVISTLLMYIFWVSLVLIPHANGEYLCQNIYIQLDGYVNPELPFFSGLFTILKGDERRGFFPSYRESKASLDSERNPMIVRYCQNLQSWVFSLENKNDQLNECSQDSTFIIGTDVADQQKFNMFEVESDSWYVNEKHSNRMMPLQEFYIFCQDKESKYTLNDSSDKFHSIEVDERLGPFVSTRSWAEQFYILQSKSFDGRKKKDLVFVYDRPVFTSADNQELILFTGKHWVITTSTKEDLKDFEENLAHEDGHLGLVSYLENEFHGLWSNYSVAFISEPVLADTPKDTSNPLGLKWYTAVPQVRNETQVADENKLVTSTLICSLCDEDSNPCFYDGKCLTESKSCQCSTGSWGTLCQVLPTSNGLCDEYFNTREYGFDGGDCCIHTCASSQIHTCGKDQSNSFHVGYDLCQEDNCIGCWKKSKLSDNLKELFVTYVALSENGRVLGLIESVGSTVRVYDSDGSKWIMRGSAVATALVPTSDIVQLSSPKLLINNGLQMSPVTVAIKNDQRVQIYDWNKILWEEVNKESSMNSFGNVKDIELRNDGKCIGILYYDGSFKLFQRKTQFTTTWALEHSRRNSYKTFSVSEDGSMFAVANETCVEIYQNGEIGKEVCLPPQKIVEVTLSPEGGMLAILVEYKGTEGDIYRFNVTRNEVILLDGVLRSVPFIDATVHITDNGMRILTHSSVDNVVRFYDWEVTRWKLLDQEIPSRRMHMSSDNTVLATIFSEQNAALGSTGLVRVYHQDNYCNRGMSEVRFTFVFDNNPDELSWEIVNITRSEEKVLLKNSGQYKSKGSMVVDKLCIPNEYLEQTSDQFLFDSCIVLNIYDLGSEGLRSPGMVGVSVNGKVRWNTSTSDGYLDRFPLFGNMTCLEEDSEPSYRSNKYNISGYKNCLGFSCEWKHIGQIFKGYDKNYHYGLSLSADGSIVAVSNATSPYDVHVFEINHKGEWKQHGLTLNSSIPSFGRSLSLSSDGSILAVGTPYSGINGYKSGTVRVFRYKTTTNKWEQIGNDINGWGSGIEFGNIVRLSSDGTVLAAATGIWGYRKCAVSILSYNFQINEWIQQGRCLTKNSYGILNNKIALSKTGSIVAYATPKAQVDGKVVGILRVFRFNEINNDWELLGNKIEGFDEWHYIGMSLSISGNGLLVAVGGWYSFGATVFEFNEDQREWQVKGQKMIAAEGDTDYVEVVLSSEGDQLGVRNGINTFLCIFIPDVGLWVRIDRQITSKETNFDFPQVVASADATLIAVQDSLHVNIYQLQMDYSLCPESQDQFKFTILPDQFPEDIGWFLYNQDGKLLSGGVLQSTSAGKELIYDKCLPKNDTVFVFGIWDMYGDGLCCDWGAGNFTVEMNNQLILNSDGFISWKVACFPEHEKLTTIEVELDGNHDLLHWYLINSNSNVVLMEAYGDISQDESKQYIRCVSLDECFIFRLHVHEGYGESGFVKYNDEIVIQLAKDEQFFFKESLIGNCNTRITCPDGKKFLEINLGLDCDTVELYWQVVDSNNKILLSEESDKYQKNFQFYKTEECLSEPISECVTIGFMDEMNNGGNNYEVIWDGELVDNSRVKGRLDKVSFGNCTTCPEGQQLFELAFLTDNYPEEFSWELISSSDKVLLSGENYSEDNKRFYYIRECVSVPVGECVTLHLNDYYGDGGTIFEAWWNGRLLQDDEQSGHKDEVKMGNCSSCPQNKTLFELDIYSHSYYGEDLEWKLFDSNKDELAGSQHSEQNKFYRHKHCLSVSPNECLTLRIENDQPGYMGTKHSVWWNGTLIDETFQTQNIYEVMMGNCTGQLERRMKYD